MTKPEYLSLFNNLLGSLKDNEGMSTEDKLSVIEDLDRNVNHLMTTYDAARAEELRAAKAGNEERTEFAPDDDGGLGTGHIVTAPLTNDQMLAIQADHAVISQHLTAAMQDRIRQRVLKVISEQLGVSVTELKDDQHVVNDLGADSLDSVELLMAIEDEFALEIPEEKEAVYLISDITRGIQAAVARGEGQ